MFSLIHFRALSLPEQVRLLRAQGQELAQRQEDGIRQKLYSLNDFFVETWHWDGPAWEAVGLVHSFRNFRCLTPWEQTALPFN